MGGKKALDLVRFDVERQIPHKHDQPARLRPASVRGGAIGGGAGERGFLPATTFGGCSFDESFCTFCSTLFLVLHLSDACCGLAFPASFTLALLRLRALQTRPLSLLLIV